LTVKVRVQEHIEPLYRDFFLSKPGGGPFPSMVEVCLIPDLCAVLEDTTIELTQSLLDPMKPALSSFVQEWQQDRQEELLNVIRKSRAYESPSKPAPTSETLRFASTVFKCGCTRAHNEPCAIGYPQVTVHPCYMVRASALRLPRPRPVGGSRKTHRLWATEKDQRAGISAIPKPPPMAGDLIRTALHDHLVFVLTDISFGEAAFTHTEALLEICGLPATTTVEELQKLDPYVVTKCGCFFAPDLLVRWASAVRFGIFDSVGF
jgi:hypothetical protein